MSGGSSGEDSVNAGLRRSDLPGLEDEPEARDDLSDPLAREGPDLRVEKGLVRRDDLRDVDDTGAGKVRLSSSKKDIPGGLGSSEVRGDGAENGRSNAAAVESIILDDDVRPPEAGFRAVGSPGIEPENVALEDHHSSFSFARTVRT